MDFNDEQDVNEHFSIIFPFHCRWMKDKPEKKGWKKGRTTFRGYFYIISFSQIHFLLDFLLPFLLTISSRFSLFLSITLLCSYSYVYQFLCYSSSYPGEMFFIELRTSSCIILLLPLPKDFSIFLAHFPPTALTIAWITWCAEKIYIYISNISFLSFLPSFFRNQWKITWKVWRDRKKRRDNKKKERKRKGKKEKERKRASLRRGENEQD